MESLAVMQPIASLAVLQPMESLAVMQPIASSAVLQLMESSAAVQSSSTELSGVLNIAFKGNNSANVVAARAKGVSLFFACFPLSKLTIMFSKKVRMICLAYLTTTVMLLALQWLVCTFLIIA